MERKKNCILIVAFIFITVLPGFTTNNKTRVYNAFIGNKMSDWKTLMDEMQAAQKNEQSFLLELVNFQYGYIGYCIGEEKTDEAEKYLGLAEKNLEKLAKAGMEKSWINAYQSAFYGFSIGLNKLKAPFLGPKSVKHAKLAIEQNPKNPMGYIQYANGQLHMPPVFGGSKKVAVEYFQKAEKIMEKDSLTLKNDWNYLSLLITIGQAYELQNDFGNAKKYYEKVLKTEPKCLWLKDEIFPQLLQKTNNK